MSFLKMVRKLVTSYQSLEKLGSKYIRTLGFTSGQFDVIVTLGNQPPMSCSELAEKTLMVKGNLTVILDGLLKKGLINKTPNPIDGRGIIVSLTEKGEETFVRIFNAHLAYLEPLAKSFTDEELTELINNFDSILRKIDNFNRLDRK